jgi:hypothetical protein
MRKRYGVKLEMVESQAGACQLLVSEACRSHAFDYVEAEPIYLLGHVLEKRGKDETAAEFFGLCEMSETEFRAEALKVGWL